MLLHELLWDANRDFVGACRNHPFVLGLADGTLDQQRFRGYVAQDAFFLRAFAKAYALALARSESVEAMRELHRLLGGVLDELTLHRKYAETLGIDLVNVQPNPACRAYTDFLLRVAWTGTPGEIVAAMTPCLRLYADLGRRLLPKAAADTPYRDWLETYAADEFEELAVWVEKLLDHLAPDTPTVRENYRYAMRCELAFFTDAFEGRE